MKDPQTSESLESAINEVLRNHAYLAKGLRSGNCLPMIRLLCHPWRDVERALPRAVSEADLGPALTNLISLRKMLIWTLTDSYSSYWIGLAVGWLEDGYPLDRGIVDAADHMIRAKYGTQAQRHSAFRIVRRWERFVPDRAPN